MKKLAYVFGAAAVLTSDVMCAAVAWDYREMLCGIAHKGYSAPAEIALFGAVPFLVAIAVFAILAVVFYKKAKKKAASK